MGNNLFKKFNFLNSTDEVSENISERVGIAPRNSKEVTIGVSNADKISESTITSTHLEDMSANICIVKDIMLNEDMGRQMLHTINRLKSGQLVIADFSSASEPQIRRDQFNALWGAVMALNGHFKKLDEQGNFYIFSSDANTIAEENAKTRESR